MHELPCGVGAISGEAGRRHLLHVGLRETLASGVARVDDHKSTCLDILLVGFFDNFVQLRHLFWFFDRLSGQV